MKRNAAVLNLLLATAYLLKERGEKVDLAKRAWLDATRKMAPEPKMPTPRAALALLGAACQLCNAAGADAPDIVDTFNASREARMGASDLDAALSEMAASILLFTMARTETKAKENAA